MSGTEIKCDLRDRQLVSFHDKSPFHLLGLPLFLLWLSLENIAASRIPDNEHIMLQKQQIAFLQCFCILLAGLASIVGAQGPSALPQLYRCSSDTVTFCLRLL